LQPPSATGGGKPSQVKPLLECPVLLVAAAAAVVVAGLRQGEAQPARV